MNTGLGVGLPILRLDMGGLTNPSPKPSDPGTLSDIMDGFVADMITARTWLESAESQGITPFEMTLGDIWFDINANGIREESESAITTLGAVVLGRQAYREFAGSDLAKRPLTIRFDESDQAWLLAYTHMLLGIGNLFMAFDPEPVFRDLATNRDALANAPQIPNYYDFEAVKKEIAVLEAESAKLKQQLDRLRPQTQRLREEVVKLKSEEKDADSESIDANLAAEISRIQTELQSLQTEQRELRQTQRIVRNELRAVKQKLPGNPARSGWPSDNDRSAIDAIYVIITALQQNPDPVRIRSAHAHFRKMIAHNRIFWDRLAAETDNDQEWIPNSTQVSALPLTIPPRLAESWQKILQDIEAVLEGKLLIPHMLLPEGTGISLYAYVNDPSPLDLVNWLHGIGAYRYAAKGPRLTAQNWRAFQRLSLGNAGGFALLFN